MPDAVNAVPFVHHSDVILFFLQVIHTFSGSRAKNSTGDWVIGVSSASAQFINAAGIDSPGLAGSPAIALEIVRLLQGAGLQLKKNPKFNPIRAPIIVPKDGWKGIKAGPVGKLFVWFVHCVLPICGHFRQISNWDTLSLHTMQHNTIRYILTRAYRIHACFQARRRTPRRTSCASARR